MQDWRRYALALATDIEQANFLLRDVEHQDDAIRMGDAECPHPLELAREGMEPQRGRERIVGEIGE